MNHGKWTNKRYQLITCAECGREILSVRRDKCRDCHEAKIYNRESLYQKLKSRNYLENDYGVITDSMGKKHIVTIAEFEKCKDILWAGSSIGYAANHKYGTLKSFLGRPNKIRKDCTKIKPDPRPKREWRYAYKIVDGLKVSNMIIYKATSPSGKIYIGKTVQLLCQRKGHHKQAANKSNKGGKFITAIRKYGIDNFKWEVLETTNDYDILNALECWYIEHYDSINKGYNICIGGDIGTTGMPCREETKRKLSNLNKGKPSGYERTYERYCRIHDEKNWPWFAAYDKAGNVIAIKRKAEELVPIVNLNRASIYDVLAGKYLRFDGITFKKLYKEDIKQLNIAV